MGFHDDERRIAALNDNHLGRLHNKAVVEVRRDGHKGSADLLLTDRIQTWLHDERCILGIDVHEGVEIFCRDGAISSRDELL
jgi:hypothetical protein